MQKSKAGPQDMQRRQGLEALKREAALVCDRQVSADGVLGLGGGPQKVGLQQA